MAIFDASATASGSSLATAIAGLLAHASTDLSGEGALTSSAGILVITNATFSGSSTFDWNYFGDGSAAISGTSSFSAAAVRIVPSSATIGGTSFFTYSTPLHMLGSSFMSVAVQVDTPIKAITMGPKTFSWMQLLQRGDLAIFICDAQSGVSPYAIKYRMLYARPDGTFKPVGPQNRTPAAGQVGEFYATGRAGELGQPGNWVIEWTFQRTYQAEHQVVEMPFQVYDAVLAADPLDITDRKQKYGWN